jgi:hypothetical protein
MEVMACRWKWVFLEAGMMQKDWKHKILKGCLEGNKGIWDGNIDMCLKETSYDFTLNSSTITLGEKSDI